MCKLHTKHRKPVCVYLVLRISFELSNSSFFNFRVIMGGFPTSIIQCVFSSIPDYSVTYCYNLNFSVFSGAQLGCAPARRFSLRVNPGI